VQDDVSADGLPVFVVVIVTSFDVFRTRRQRQR
jgi:hypothetical protein